MESEPGPTELGPHSTPEHGADSPGSVRGGAFDPELPQGKASGELVVGVGELCFSAASRQITLPLSGLCLRLGGAGNRVLFFTHSSLPDVTLYTSDREILDAPAFSHDPALAAQLRLVRSRHRYDALWVAGICLTLAVAVWGLWRGRDAIVRTAVAKIPPKLERRFGELAFSQIQLDRQMIQDSELREDLRELVSPLLEATSDSSYAYRFHLARDPSVNAFALPGGIVVLHSGLILRAESAEEILGVLAHEIAHVTERHSLRQLVGSASLYLMVQSLLGDTSGIAAVLAQGGFSLLTLEFSRDFEREADDVGFDSLLAAGIDPRGMLTFFEKLQASRDGAASQGLENRLSFLSTHPTTQERIDRLRTKLHAVASDAESVTFDLAAFQDRLRSIQAEDPLQPEPSAGGRDASQD